MTTFSFNPSATAYDPVNAYSLGLAASLAYSDGPAIQQKAAEWGFDRFHFFDADETQAYLIGNDTMAILAFRGTEPKKIQDILSDVRLGLVDFPGGKAHQGFTQALARVWPDVLGKLAQFQDQTLWVTGHSLGAALAALATAYLRLEAKKPVAGLYTFGQPRAGNRAFAQTFDQDFKPRNFRFINNNDVVTQVPVPGLLLKYSHVGTGLYFDSQGKLLGEVSWLRQFLAGAQGRLADLGKIGSDGLKDHFMDNYLKCLSQNLPGKP